MDIWIIIGIQLILKFNRNYRIIQENWSLYANLRLKQWNYSWKPICHLTMYLSHYSALCSLPKLFKTTIVEGFTCFYNLFSCRQHQAGPVSGPTKSRTFCTTRFIYQREAIVNKKRLSTKSGCLQQNMNKIQILVKHWCRITN